MTSRRLLLVLSAVSIASICGCAGSRSDSYTDTGVSSDVGFYDDLARYGAWENVAPYGECWVPLDVPAGWRPYTVGYWEYTDYGWMWISQDPWGGVPYHYGRWAEDDAYGWVWVPDNDEVWAPAWVAWRYGDSYVGWAPLHPDVGWQSGIGLSMSGTELDGRVTPTSWCFTPARDFGTTKVRTSVLPPSRNMTLISATQNVTRYEVINSRPAERGLNPEILERDTGRKFLRYRIADSGSPSPREAVHGQTIDVYRVPVAETRNPTPRPIPQEQRTPSRAMIQRLDVEQRQFDQRMEQERAALAREQQREINLNQHGRTSVPSDEMRQRHQAETRMQQEREDRERRALDRRRKIIQDMQSAHAQDKDKGQPDQGQGKSQDKGQGNGHGNSDQDKDRDRGRDQGNGGH